MAPGELDFEHVSAEAAKERAEQGARHAQRAGFEADAKGGVSAPTWEAIDLRRRDPTPADRSRSRALSGLGELVKGSTSHQVAEHAGRPVLIVPPPQADGRQPAPIREST